MMSVPPYTCARLVVCRPANVETAPAAPLAAMTILVLVLGGALIALAAWEWLRGRG